MLLTTILLWPNIDVSSKAKPSFLLDKKRAITVFGKDANIYVLEGALKRFESLKRSLEGIYSLLHWKESCIFFWSRNSHLL